MKKPITLLAILLGTTAAAEDMRQMDAHEHGVGQLNIAVAGNVVEMEFEAPGADIVGFEYEATSETDLAAIEAAIETLEAPLALFTPSSDAECTVSEAHAALAGEEEHDDHDAHDDHDHDAHDHDGHDDHADHEGHTEFHAHYALTCENTAALSGFEFPYFATFENAVELEVQIVSQSGAQAFEVERDEPMIEFGNLE